MTRKIISWLPLWAVFLFTLSSCVHDEVYSASDPESGEYTNKSLWKEDEKYIKNVKQIFDEYADHQYFSSSFGTVYWDYATTLGTYDESLLEVPVIKNSEVSFILLVYREGDRVFFKRKDEENSKKFFHTLVFTDRQKHRVSGKIPAGNKTASKTVCYTMETTVTWTNDDGSAGPTFSFSETHCFPTGPSLPCQAVDMDQTCGGGGGSHGGSSGGGGGNNGYPYPPAVQNPCEKLKAQHTDPSFKAKLDNLKTKTANSSESGYRVGAPVSGSGQNGAQYQELSNKPGTTDLDFKIFNTTTGIMHSHYDGLVPIFSPGDINLFIQLLQNAQTNNIPLSEVFLSVVTSSGVYQLRGDGIDVNSLSMYTGVQIDALNDKYLTKMGSPNISTENLQKEFLKFMKENMNINGAKLYQTNSDGNSKQLLLNGNNLSTANCP